MSRDHDVYGDMDDAQFAQPVQLGRAGPDAEVTQFLAELRILGEGAAPQPSPEVAALLGGARLLRRRAVRVVARSAVAVAVVLAALVVAAANHTLPALAQRVVSNVVNEFTPFHISPDRGQPPVPVQHKAPVHRDDSGRSPEPERSGSVTEPTDEPSSPERSTGQFGTEQSSERAGGDRTNGSGD